MHARFGAHNGKRLMPDLSSLQIAHPATLPWIGIGAVLGLLVLLLPWRHGKRTVAIAGTIRVIGVAALVFALAGFVETQPETSRFEPHGVWRLLLDDRAPAANATDFRETPLAFTNRVRSALAGEKPPQRAEVWGSHEEATRARDAVLALGLPCTAHWPEENVLPSPMILHIDAPTTLQPGEAGKISVSAFLAGATLKVLLDGAELPHKSGKAEFRLDKPGVHLLEAVLYDAHGNELQRDGAVVRVGEPPVLLMLGLTKEHEKRVTELAPGWKTERGDLAEFDARRFDNPDNPVGVVLTSVDALYQLSLSNPSVIYGLSFWVARGGGLYITGDGAKFVAPEYLAPEAKMLLPVTLLKEGKPPEPEDPPVEEIKGKAEVAKASIVYVLDRSGSMNATVNRRADLTRWRVACKGVTEALKKIKEAKEQTNTRVGVLSFTLKQTWIDKPRVFIDFDVKNLAQRLAATEGDAEFDEMYYNTDVYAAMREALDVIKKENSAVKVIVLMTDGADRPANAREGKLLSNIAEEARRETVNIMTVGIGDAFVGGTPEVLAARKTIEDLATKQGFSFIPGEGEAAEKAHVIFVTAVETAFKAYDDQKKAEEEERKRKLDEQKAAEQEPPKVDVLAGEFQLTLLPPGKQLFGPNALPKPAPRATWYARSTAKPEAAVTLGLNAVGDPPALAFHAYGLGRTAFWSVGGEPESLGEITAWGDFPGVFAASLRWLLPREVPDVRLVGEATPEGIRLLDPLPGANYVLRTASGDLALELADGLLTRAGGLPTGAAEVIEQVDDEQRRIGDVYIARKGQGGGFTKPVDDNPKRAELAAKLPETRLTRRDWPMGAVYLCALFLILMPLERLVRRRS